MAEMVACHQEAWRTYMRDLGRDGRLIGAGDPVTALSENALVSFAVAR